MGEEEEEGDLDGELETRKKRKRARLRVPVRAANQWHLFKPAPQLETSEFKGSNRHGERLTGNSSVKPHSCCEVVFTRQPCSV